MKPTVKYRVPIPRVAVAGSLKIGGNQPLVIQSMANTNTNHIEESAAQAKAIAESGAEMVRFTTQGLREVKSLEKVVQSLKKEGQDIPVVADVHFSSKIAVAAAAICHKVRINPGNFNERKSLQNHPGKNTLQQDKAETRKQFTEFLEACRLHHTAIRIGVNHGSLSERIMNLYGDTPEGMVASAKEFIEMCMDEDFDNVVVSLKSSNSALMTKSVRLLARELIENDMYFPLHLGVTEAGDGLEGRIKSTVGIAPLLLEGIGNTIRVSLTEPPENEIPVAKTIVELFPKPDTLPYNPFYDLPWDPFSFTEFRSERPVLPGGGNYPLVIAAENENDPLPDIIAEKSTNKTILKFESVKENLTSLSAAIESNNYHGFIRVTTGDHPEKIANLKGDPVLILDAEENSMYEIKSWLIGFHANKIPLRLIFRKEYHIQDEERFAILASGEYGFLLTDQLIDGIWLENKYTCAQFNSWLSFKILQAAGARITTTDYIACPSCGRTLFDIQSVLAHVKDATSHLKGLKIAVMGCIVNGPGEMADADYGYIGAGKGLVNIYKGKIQVRKNIPEAGAIKALEDVIRENGDWRSS